MFVFQVLHQNKEKLPVTAFVDSVPNTVQIEHDVILFVIIAGVLKLFQDAPVAQPDNGL